jgi:NAD-dependent DNA ligase
VGEQEMRKPFEAWYEDWLKDAPTIIGQEDLASKAWQAATLAAEARIRDLCIKVADEIYTQIAISVTATKIPAIVDSVLDATLAEHKEQP